MINRQSIETAPRDGTRIFSAIWSEFWGNEEQLGHFENAADGKGSWVTDLGSVPDDHARKIEAIPGDGLYPQDDITQYLGPTYWAPLTNESF